ncbi:hypothetical protein DPM13_07810 [Paracoccus mutanolyticus]|uniref:Uncharacterized protein n=1 Tax=Paracoccus mutanolyticus TaxID=1499308 RepID=A0ABM6WR93_9RHOB|nr:hypothetical protein [Paracoccus mutanolyticus]AWX93087.1 hypothetical protein DPM13_07810 [Paracoccus mutanolyticus]
MYARLGIVISTVAFLAKGRHLAKGYAVYHWSGFLGPLAREGSRHGLEAFTDIKYVCRDWSQS